MGLRDISRVNGQRGEGAVNPRQVIGLAQILLRTRFGGLYFHQKLAIAIESPPRLTGCGFVIGAVADGCLHLILQGDLRGRIVLGGAQQCEGRLDALSSLLRTAQATQCVRGTRQSPRLVALTPHRGLHLAQPL